MQTFPDEIEQQAAHWLARDQAGELDAAGRGALEQWRASDPRHQAAYMDLAAGWDAAGIAAGAYLAMPMPGRAPRRTGRFARVPAIAIAASVVLAVTAVGAWRLLDAAATPTLRFQTARGEMRSTLLADGSTLVLGAASEVEVRLEARERRLVLLSGEALFQVAHDTTRPFRVTAGARTIEAVGTEFDVRRDGDNVQVAVREGVVRVASPADAGPGAPRDAALLRQGQGVAFAAEGRLGAIRQVPADQIGAWRQGVLYYDRTPLGQVVADLNRHMEQRIVVADPALARLTVNAVFQLRDPKAALEALQQMLGLRVRYGTDGTVTLQGTP